MTPLAWVLLGLAAFAAAIDWAAVAGAKIAVERVAKPAVLVLLLAAAIVLEPVDPAVRPWLLLALAASLVGDVLLLPPGRFTGGLVAFLVAQLAYLMAFLQLPGNTVLAVVGVGLAFALVAFVGRSIVEGARPSGLALPVAVYLAAICLMAISGTRTGIPAVALGAWVFVASDATLGWDRFAAPEPGSARVASLRRLAVMVTYHAGQALLVIGLAA